MITLKKIKEIIQHKISMAVSIEYKIRHSRKEAVKKHKEHLRKSEEYILNKRGLTVSVEQNGVQLEGFIVCGAIYFVDSPIYSIYSHGEHNNPIGLWCYSPKSKSQFTIVSNREIKCSKKLVLTEKIHKLDVNNIQNCMLNSLGGTKVVL